MCLTTHSLMNPADMREIYFILRFYLKVSQMYLQDISFFVNEKRFSPRKQKNYSFVNLLFF